MFHIFSHVLLPFINNISEIPLLETLSSSYTSQGLHTKVLFDLGLIGSGQTFCLTQSDPARLICTSFHLTGYFSIWPRPSQKSCWLRNFPSLPLIHLLWSWAKSLPFSVTKTIILLPSPSLPSSIVATTIENHPSSSLPSLPTFIDVIVSSFIEKIGMSLPLSIDLQLFFNFGLYAMN